MREIFEAKSSAPLRQIKRVQFGTLGPDETKMMSVAKIDCSDTIVNGKVVPGGLMDLRMGTMDFDHRCTTCFGDNLSCPGHFGHIELERPVFNMSLIEKTVKYLKCICHSCSRLLIADDEQALNSLKKIESPSARLIQCVELCMQRRVCALKKQVDDDDRQAKMLHEFGEPVQPTTSNALVLAPSSSASDPAQICCGSPAPKTITHSHFDVTCDWGVSSADDMQDRKKIYCAEKVMLILKRIREKDFFYLGCDPQYARPDWLVHTVFPVPPLAVRPSILLDSSSRGHDDLTYKLAQVIKTNNVLKTDIINSTPQHQVDEHTRGLQFHATTLVDNERPGLPVDAQKSGRPIKSLRQRLKSKEGRVRGNLMGKRVDFSARTVITADPNLSIDQVGVPRSIAQNMTYPEVVTRFNIARLQELVHRGPNSLPGAKNIIRDDGTAIDLRFNKNPDDLTLAIGYKVERYMQDDDLVIFNRQPSLHKMSMMGHRVKVLPHSTFRMNLSVTSPYNADFDGDEMNLHLPQSVMARAEIEQIMMVPRQIVTPQSCKPVMSIVQDALTAVRKSTKRDVFIEYDTLCNLLLLIPDWNGVVPLPCIIKPKPLWSGKQLISFVFPKNFNYSNFGSQPDEEKREDLRHNTPSDIPVLVDSGYLVHGMIDKSTVGTSGGGIIHTLFAEYGENITMGFFNTLQKLMNNYLLIEGHSMSMMDCIADPRTMDVIRRVIKDKKHDVTTIVQRAQAEELKPTPGNSLRQTFENEVNKSLSDARDKAGKEATKSLSEFNNMKAMVVSGAKGNHNNIAQVIACVGQQNVEGKRIKFGFQFRTLPHFVKDDYGAESRGFVENSYLSGLNPAEFFFHAMAGREGLIDTACKTAETGYIQRRLVKAMEDVMIQYDGTVRNSTGHVIQFVYGEDGMDGAFLEKQWFDTKRLSDRAFEDKYKVTAASLPKLKSLLAPSAYEIIVSDSETQHLLQQEFAQIHQDRLLLREIYKEQNRLRDDDCYLPVNFTRLIWNANKAVSALAASSSVISSEAGGTIMGATAASLSHVNSLYFQSDLTVKEVIEGVRNLCDRLIVTVGQDRVSKEHQESATLMFKIMTRQVLSFRRVVEEHKLKRAAFNYVLSMIENKFRKSMVQPGEMVGALASQSIGEPATQMTLNTFHHTGIASKNVTLGVPRLKELINVAKNPRTPSLLIYLDDAHRWDKHEANKVLAQVEHTTLKKITLSTHIYYDPDPFNTIIPQDQEFVTQYYEVPDEGFGVDKISPWLLRMELDIKNMIAYDLHMEQVAEIINSLSPNEIKCIFSDDNADQRILRIRVLKQENTYEEFGKDGEVAQKRSDQETLRTFEQCVLPNLTIKGIPAIPRVFLNNKDHQRQVVLPDGTIKTEEEWVLETDGSDLMAVLSNPYVDARSTTSNDVVEIFRILGIEAARVALYREIHRVISFYGLYVNYRHLANLCDLMTFQGHLMAITRHGINKSHSGPLMKCSFEQTVEVLMEAAAHAETDFLTGVTESILLGQLTKLGTGACRLFVDANLVETAMDIPLQAISSLALGDQAHHAGAAAGGGPILALPQAVSGRAGASYGSYQTATYNASSATPYYAASPGYGSDLLSLTNGSSSGAAFSPEYTGSGNSGAAFNPLATNATGLLSGATSSSPGASGFGKFSSPVAGYSPSPSYSPSSPSYSPTSPVSRFVAGGVGIGKRTSGPNYSVNTSPSYTPTSPMSSSSYSPSSPAGTYPQTSPTYSPTSPAMGMYSATSPTYSPTSPAMGMYSATSPTYSPTSPAMGMYSATSPTYSPTSPAMGMYSATSPTYSPTSPAMGMYSATSPTYSPTSPAMGMYSATSPTYSPTSPAMGMYSATSPTYSPTSPAMGMYSATSPTYSPTSPAMGMYSATSPTYSPTSPLSGGTQAMTSPMYSPTSPTYNYYGSTSPTATEYAPATSPTYSPSSLTYSFGTGTAAPDTQYSFTSPNYSPTSPMPSSPSYSPLSPVYCPTSPARSPGGSAGAGSKKTERK